MPTNNDNCITVETGAYDSYGNRVTLSSWKSEPMLQPASRTYVPPEQSTYDRARDSFLFGNAPQLDTDNLWLVKKPTNKELRDYQDRLCKVLKIDLQAPLSETATNGGGSTEEEDSDDNEDETSHCTV